MHRLLHLVTIFSLLVPVLLLTGCYISEPDEAALSIRTDAPGYGPDDSMTVTFRNDSGRRYLLGSSGCVTLDEKPLPVLSYERLEGDRWIGAGGPICPRIAVPPVELKSSERYSVTFRAYVSAMEFVPGMYRLRFYFSDAGGRQVPSDEEQFSNTFHIDNTDAPTNLVVGIE